VAALFCAVSLAGALPRVKSKLLKIPTEKYLRHLEVCTGPTRCFAVAWVYYSLQSPRKAVGLPVKTPACQPNPLLPAQYSISFDLAHPQWYSSKSTCSQSTKSLLTQRRRKTPWPKKYVCLSQGFLPIQGSKLPLQTRDKPSCHTTSTNPAMRQKRIPGAKFGKETVAEMGPTLCLTQACSGSA
jgi:hypothetical protein